MSCKCNCKGNTRKVVKWKTLQQGDSFGFTVANKINDVATDVEEGYTIECGFYDFANNPLLKLRIDNGLSRVDTGTYYAFIEHTQTSDWIGDIRVEFVIYKEDGTVADATEELLLLNFEPRELNN